MSRKTFRDRDYFEDKYNLTFSVIGNIHPPKRVISYVKYAPTDEESIWRKEDKSYERVLKYYSASYVKITKEFLRQRIPNYLVDDPVFGVELIEVPHDLIAKHFIPEDRLSKILLEPNDILENVLANLANTILEHVDIRENTLGVTGSILLGIHNIYKSDIDLIVYGLDNAFRIRDFLHEALGSRDFGFSRLNGEILDQYVKRIVYVHPFTVYEARRYYLEAWNRGLYSGRFFSIHPVLTDEEVPEKYGDRVFRGEGLIKIRARVIDDTYSIFLPAIYYINDVDILEGPKVEEIVEVCSYEGLYSDIAHRDEEIVVYGKLEKVDDKRRGKEYYRIVIGSFEAEGKDYIKPIRWMKSGSKQ